MKAENKAEHGRRKFFARIGRYIAGGILALLAIVKGIKLAKEEQVWQINPHKCVKCGRCATECVLNPSAVRCVHAHEMCGYCDLCFGYFLPSAAQRNEAAENQTCPTGAINRRFIEEPYFEYSINTELCFGCGKCVEGCTAFGNGSLYLQVARDICTDCNECAIARNCAGNAFEKVPRSRGYIRKEDSLG